MKTKLILFLALSFTFGSASAEGLPEMQLLIKPGIPDSNETISIKVKNSACYYNAQVLLNSALKYYTIRLFYSLGEEYESCRESSGAKDFETSIGPLATGEWGVFAETNTGGFPTHEADAKVLTVVEAPPLIDLSPGGINGMYYQPEADGRYVYILETDYTTLVMWNTFDADGNQLWVYGMGQLQNGGQTVVARTFINRSVGFLPDGEVEVQDDLWGWMRVDLTSCTEGTVTYQSDLPEYGSGQFFIDRLAYAKQIGCSDNN